MQKLFFFKGDNIFRLLLFPILVSSFIRAECGLNDDYLSIIQMNERNMGREIGYPYLISFNSKKEANVVRNSLDGYWIDDRTIDCEDRVTCKYILHSLEELNINNLDLGSFQLNKKYHKLNEEDYFDNEKEKQVACTILESNFKKYGYSWKTFANYHSKTKKHNKRYREKLMVNLQILKKKKGIIYE